MCSSVNWWPARLFQMATQLILMTSIRGETDVLAYFSREDIFQKMPSQHFEWVAVKGRLMLYTTLADTQPTPLTPTHLPQTLPSISPIIVSSLPDETAVKLKESRMKSTTRKKYIQKCLGEIFTQDELVASNLSGTKVKQKLNKCKIRSIFSEYIIKSTSWSIRVKDSRQFIQIIVGITDTV